MASLRVSTDTIEVRFTRVEKLLGLVRDLDVPLSAVVSVVLADKGVTAVRGIRAPGLGVPGVRLIGTWRGQGRTLVSVTRDQPAVVIDLGDQRYARLIIGADDAAVLVDELRRAAAAAR